jgi:hypothetical protein
MTEIYTRQQYWGDPTKKKNAEVGDIMPNTAGPDDKPDKGTKSVIPKTATLVRKDDFEALAYPDGVQGEGVSGEQPKENPQAKPIHPRVVVTGKEPPKIIKEKYASHFAMPSIQRYPLDSYAQVKQAAAYFEDNRGRLAPIHRREFCTNLVKRASSLGIPVSEEVQSYGGVGYAPHEELEVALGSRRLLLHNDDHAALLGKLAEARVSLSADDFAVALSEFDKIAGLDEYYDSDVVDPFLCIFGKTAATPVDDESFVIGNDMVTAGQLHHLAATACANIQDRFGEDFVKEFKKDPLSIFKSLPADQKKVICREANEPRVSN